MWHNSFVMCGMTRSYVWHDSSVCVTQWLIQMWHNSFLMCGMTRSNMWHDSLIMCDIMTHSDVAQFICDVWHGFFICVTWPIDNVWHEDSFRCGTTHSWCVACLVHMCDMTHLYARDTMTHSDVAQLILDVWHDSFICVTWLVDNVWRDDSFVRVTWDIDNVWHNDSFRCGTTHSWFMAWLIHMCDMTHPYVWHND